MDLFNLTIIEEFQDEFQIALVDEGAIESDTQFFNKQQQFKVIDEDRRIIAGYAMIADKEIPRFEDPNEGGRGKYKVKFTKESIWEIALKFFKNRLTTNTNEMHNTGHFAPGVFVFGSVMIDRAMGDLAPKKFITEADGSWFIKMFIENDEIWAKIKSGEYMGFSIECKFHEELVSTDADDFTDEMNEKVDALIAELKETYLD